MIQKQLELFSDISASDSHWTLEEFRTGKLEACATWRVVAQPSLAAGSGCFQPPVGVIRFALLISPTLPEFWK